MILWGTWSGIIGNIIGLIIAAFIIRYFTRNWAKDVYDAVKKLFDVYTDEVFNQRKRLRKLRSKVEDQEEMIKILEEKIEDLENKKTPQEKR